MSDLTASRVRELFHYDHETGTLTWLVRKASRIHIGDVAGSVNGDGYRETSIDDRSYKNHRLAWLYIYGTWPKNEVDHINGRKLDNRIANLRDVSQSINQQNRKSAICGRGLSLLGVYRRRNKFSAKIVVNGRAKHLGTFPTQELAHGAYVDAKRKYHPGCTL